MAFSAGSCPSGAKFYTIPWLLLHWEWMLVRKVEQLHFFCACPLIVRDGQPEFREGNGRVTVGSGDVAW
jgi:hypothetical protein